MAKAADVVVVVPELGGRLVAVRPQIRSMGSRRGVDVIYFINNPFGGSE